MSDQLCDGDAELNAKVALSLVVLLALAGPLPAKEPLQAGERVVLTKGSPGCAKREEFDRLVDIAQRHDAVAFTQYRANHKCPVLQAGTIAIREDWAYSGRAMCIRRPGESDCLWIPSAAAQKTRQFVPATRTDELRKGSGRMNPNRVDSDRRAHRRALAEASV